MKATAISLAILALILAVATGFFFNKNRLAQMDLEKFKGQAEELKFKVNDLETKNAELANRLTEEVAKLSREKEEEIQKLTGAQNELVEELKSEIDKKEIEITQLADRLSVSMVDKILFPSGEAELTPEGLKVIERVGIIIKNVSGKTIRVEGHTDNVPIHPKLQKQFPSNWELSTARATNVVRFLQDKVGIDAERLQAVGLSEYHPVASNATSDGRSKNRRIEIVLIPMEAPGVSASPKK